MVSPEHLSIIEKEVKEVFARLGVENDAIQVQESNDVTIAVRVTMTEPQLFIGERGQTLFEIQHVLKSILRKKIPEQISLSLDINDYRKNKEDYLRDLAKTTADEVALLKKEKELPPMPPAERRIVHIALSERSDVISESVGEGEERRVVIKPKG